MNKAEVVDQVSERAGMSKKDAQTAVEAILETIEETLARGEDVTFTGFGKFVVRDRAARMGVNPRTKERVEIAATRAPRFSPGSQLKQAVSA
jgi:DNA-binding protein HU-beta